MSPTHGLHTLTQARGVLYGGDYNPEQWPREVWREDVALMREAGVNLVTVGVFSWSVLEPEPGVLDFGWLDEVLGLLADADIAVDLATPSASAPPWLARLHPESSSVDARGVRMAVGSRNHFCPSAPAYRDAALRVARALAHRYAGHPALALWHVGNEYGQECFCDLCADRWRAWLAARYGDVARLNDAWGTAFWSQRYGTLEEVVPPRAAPYLHNPAQAVDWRRFTSDQMRALYREQAAVLRAAGDVPVTTNFMGFFGGVDQHTWTDDLDVVADDHYGDPQDPTSPARSALTHDLTRGVGRGAPWLLMEQAAGAVNWRPHNVPKTPAQMLQDSLRAVAHGADGVCYFQWRASAAGAESFHSALLPHAGPDTVLHRAVRAQGRALAALRPVVGARVPARAALVHDWPALWASELPARPSDRLRVLDQLEAYHRPLWRAGIATDVVPSTAPLDGYDLVVVPALPLVSDAAAAAIAAVPQRGGVLVVGPFSGVQDPTTRVRTGAFPAPWTGVLGLAGEEWRPLPDAGVPVRSERYGDFVASTWSERLRADDADVLATYAGADLEGAPAVLRRADPSGGQAWYVSTLPPQDVLDRVVRDAADAAGLRPPLPGAPDDVEVAVRGGLVFVLNLAGEPRVVTLPRSDGPVRDLLGGAVVDGRVTLPAGGAAVLEHAPAAPPDPAHDDVVVEPTDHPED
ncbi:beta-galactosidase [Cellulomonas sp.]|uniref:beta-galactosidase n=1 Tax=Cellulomonas sp. TaxID=40001 RepID=UPI00258F77E8|nr:beta-galactosidase [Cellulomonas sp.]MCR6689300.1 beta-galactosidase [Cellulomonas sp.]